MLLEQLKESMGIEGWAVVVATFTFAITRLFKQVPKVPNSALPRVALAVAFVTVAGDALLGGATLRQAVQAGFNGLIAGTFAITGKDALKPLVAKLLSPQLADLIFGKGQSDLDITDVVDLPPSDDGEDDDGGDDDGVEEEEEGNSNG